MRTSGKVFVGAEVSPELRNAIKSYADAKNISVAEAVRDSLLKDFGRRIEYMELNGGSDED